MKIMNVLFLMISFASAGSPAGSSVTYMVDGEEYEGYYASPSSKAPLVFIIHDWDGLTDYEIKRVQMLFELGYAAFAIDLYGKGVRPTEFQEKHRLTSELYLDRPKMRKRLQGSLAAARAQKAEVTNAVAIGYCFGGAAVLEWARAGTKLKGFVPFHGGLDTPDGEDYSDIKGEILVFHGSADASVSMEDFAALAVELEANKVSHEMISYSGAPHAFTVFGSTRYQKEADQKSWNRFTLFLTEILK